jgi:hypothetical protein
MAIDAEKLDDLSRRILRLLMSGWMTTEQVKTAAELTPDEIANALKEPLDAVVEALAVLEVTGDVERIGVPDADPTLLYKGVDEPDPRAGKGPGREFYITETGKQRVVAELLNETPPSAPSHP